MKTAKCNGENECAKNISHEDGLDGDALSHTNEMDTLYCGKMQDGISQSTIEPQKEIMEHILEQKSPAEQIAMYLNLILPLAEKECPQHVCEESNIAIARELLECAKHLIKYEEVQMTLIAAYLFVNSTSIHRRHGAFMLPIIAALLDPKPTSVFK